jgi:hypothetical protein
LRTGIERFAKRGEIFAPLLLSFLIDIALFNFPQNPTNRSSGHYAPNIELKPSDSVVDAEKYLAVALITSAARGDVLFDRPPSR